MWAVEDVVINSQPFVGQYTTNSRKKMADTIFRTIYKFIIIVAPIKQSESKDLMSHIRCRVRSYFFSSLMFTTLMPAVDFRPCWIRKLTERSASGTSACLLPSYLWCKPHVFICLSDLCLFVLHRILNPPSGRVSRRSGRALTTINRRTNNHRSLRSLWICASSN